MVLWIRFRMTGLANPSRPSWVARKISAIPPSATRLMILYRPCCAIPNAPTYHFPRPSVRPASPERESSPVLARLLARRLVAWPSVSRNVAPHVFDRSAARVRVIAQVEVEQLGELLRLCGRHLVASARRGLGRCALFLLRLRALLAVARRRVPGSGRLLGLGVDLLLQLFIPLLLAPLRLAVAGTSALRLLVAETGGAVFVAATVVACRRRADRARQRDDQHRPEHEPEEPHAAPPHTS